MKLANIRKRSGFTSTELVVACSILVTAILVVGSMAVRTTRVWQDTRHQQIALEELSQQIERITALTPADRIEALRQITPSEQLLSIAPKASNEAKVTEEPERRVTLELNWNFQNRPRASISLVAWVDPLPEEKREIAE